MTTTPARDALAKRIEAAVKTVLPTSSTLTHAVIADAVMPVLDIELAAQRAELTDLLRREKDRADAAIGREETADAHAAEVRAAALHDAAEKLRAAAPAHYMCDSGFGCERCTYDDVISRIRRMAAATRPETTGA